MIKLVFRWSSFLLYFALLVCSSASAQDEVDYEIRQKDDSVSIAINAVLQEIFWRVRANDYSAFYDYEYPHIRKTMKLDAYLKGASFRRPRAPNSDTMTVMRLDSVGLKNDAARVFVTLTVTPLSGDSAYALPSVQNFYYVEGRWIRPLTSSKATNDEYNQIIENYEKAVSRDEEKGG